MKTFEAGDVRIGDGMFIIAGPCVIEGERECFETALAVKKVCRGLGIPLIFKSSYYKANRTSGDSYAGPGAGEGLRILGKIREELSVPVLADVHCREEVERCAEVVDVIQIPAFLCRQTPLLIAAAESGLPVNVKKGQFLSPHEAENVIRKLERAGSEKIMITERGFSFGYNNLVVDMRAFPVMGEFGYPVVFDATHSVQLPGGRGGCSGGDRRHVLPLARAAAGAGCEGFFAEVHLEPERALCDGDNMLAVEQLEDFLRQVKGVVSTVREFRAKGAS